MIIHRGCGGITANGYIMIDCGNIGVLIFHFNSNCICAAGYRDICDKVGSCAIDCRCCAVQCRRIKRLIRRTFPEERSSGALSSGFVGGAVGGFGYGVLGTAIDFFARSVSGNIVAVGVLGFYGIGAAGFNCGG